MTLRPSAPVLAANPFLIWGTLAVKSFEMSTAAAQVISIRVSRMVAAGANPTAADQREMAQMGTEKVEAFSRAGIALASGMTPAVVNVGAQTLGAWLAIFGAGTRWATSRTVPQSLRHHRALTQTLLRHAPAVHHGSHAAAKLAHLVLAPVHLTATANARRLARLRK